MMTRLRTAGLALAMILTTTTLSQMATGTLAPAPYLTVFDDNGVIVPGACIWTYVAGTTTPVATYTDVGLSVANGNPIIADSTGRFVAYLALAQSYKFIFETACTPPAHGATIKTSDNIAAVPASSNNVDVVGTAGVTLSAGQCAYMSDGSDGHTPGQWFKCDSGSAFTSTTPEIGIPVTAITSGTSGPIRIMGSVTGLSSLSVGVEYFVGVAGALTAVVPTNPNVKRHVGHADSSTSLVLTGDPPPPHRAQAAVNNFRLSAISGQCSTLADVTAITSIALTPCNGARITLADTLGNMETCVSDIKTVAVPNVAAQMYDVFAYDTTFGTCDVQMETLAWTNDTTRATGISRGTIGFIFKTGDSSRRYLGSFRTVAGAGQTEDSAAKRLLWNYDNRRPRPLFKTDTTDSWNYTTAAWRQANGAAANQVGVVVGLSEGVMSLQSAASAVNNTAEAIVFTAIGEDSTTTPHAQNLAKVFRIGAAATTHGSGFSLLNIVPPIGRH